MTFDEWWVMRPFDGDVKAYARDAWFAAAAAYNQDQGKAATPTMWETLLRWLDLSRSDVEFSLMEWEVEELIEMAKNAKRYQWIRGTEPSKVETLIYSYGGAALDAAIDDEMEPLSMGGE